MSNEQKYIFHGGPLDNEVRPAPVKGMGRTPNYLLPADNGLAVLRADKADQILGRGSRSGTPVNLYLLTESEENKRYHHYAWIEYIAARPVLSAGSAGFNEFGSAL